MELNNISIYEFNEPVEYLNAIYAAKKERNQKFSIRSWASQLGHANPSLLAQTLKGQRKVGSKMAIQVSEQLKLSKKEKRYFEVLALFSKARKISEKELFLDLLNELRPKSKVQSIELDYFKYISDWYHMAIFEMTALKCFSNDPSVIAKKLKGGITPVLVEKAIERLLRLGLLENDNGNIKRTNSEELVLNYQIPSSAIKKYHKQMLAKSIEAIDTQSVDEREISSTTLSIKTSDLKNIKELMNKFHQEIRKFSQSEDADDTYQFNIQFFNLTKEK